ncbi:Helix-turn-helix domain protein [compost metagenome]
MAPDEQDWLTPAEVAQRLKVNEQSVRRWLREGRLRGSLLGRVWRVSPAALGEFMKAHEPAPEKED